MVGGEFWKGSLQEVTPSRIDRKDQLLEERSTPQLSQDKGGVVPRGKTKSMYTLEERAVQQKQKRRALGRRGQTLLRNGLDRTREAVCRQLPHFSLKPSGLHPLPRGPRASRHQLRRWEVRHWERVRLSGRKQPSLHPRGGSSRRHRLFPYSERAVPGRGRAGARGPGRGRAGPVGARGRRARRCQSQTKAAPVNHVVPGEEVRLVFFPPVSGLQAERDARRPPRGRRRRRPRAPMRPERPRPRGSAPGPMETPPWDPARNDSLPPTLTPAVPPYVKLGLTVVYTVFYALLFVFIYVQLWLVLRYRHKRLSYQSVFLFLCLFWASLRTVLFSFYFKDFVAANSLSPFVFWLLYCFPVCLQFFTLTLMNLYFTQVIFKAKSKYSPELLKYR
uniref:uncharacterized protein LOC114675324 n=1 Tax=Macaca mulatta TaxID=9544 RepID=UPI0010A29986|nr:uncharacterized protein LOC114675324 [Macaca mulatta]